MELTFSKMSVDTSLAQEYLKNNEVLSELYSDYDGNIKKNPDIFGEFYQHINFNLLNTYMEMQKVLWNLAAKLKQNTELIAQLEYHIRKIPVEDTKAQLHVLMQYINIGVDDTMLKYSLQQDPQICNDNFQSTQHFMVGDPLLILAKVVFMMVYNNNSRIILYTTTKEPVAICHLFIKLCREAGHSGVLLKCRSNAIPPTVVDNKHGTVAVVSEDADLDSAVDKFISSSKQVPWYLRRILVQENVYKQFKDALNWKCSLKKNEEGPVLSSALCSQALTYEGRTFLIDPVQVVEAKQSIVTVEAYRTTKEMISMLQEIEPLYLSLWINGIAQINEVTQSTKSAVVWVNNIGDIRGPPHVARALCPFLEGTYHSETFDEKDNKIAKLVKLTQSWSKLDLESRRDILINVLENNKGYSQVRNSLLNFTSESFVQVGKDYTCTGTWKPAGFIAIPADELPSNLLVNLVLQGNALVLYKSPLNPAEASYIELLEAAGVPIVYVENCPAGNFKANIYNKKRTRTLRVIWTNSGTIFAN